MNYGVHMSDIFKLLADDPELEKTLYKGRQLADADPDSLQITTMPSGFDCFDNDTMLLKKSEGELIIFCGEASMGKSSLMLKIAFNVSADRPVHIFSLEDSYESIVRRRLAGEVKMTIADIQRGLNKDRIIPGLASLKSRDFFIDDTGGLRIDDICERARTRHKKYRTELIVIDHLQVIGTDPTHSRALEIGNITYKCKALAKELRVPVFLASQMNRQNAGRENKKPQLTDLKESSSIEQNADVVVAIFREYRYTKLREFEADVSVLKNRNGPVSDFILKFHPATADFTCEDYGI